MSITFQRDIVSLGWMPSEAFIAPATEKEGFADEKVGAWYSEIRSMGPSLRS